MLKPETSNSENSMSNIIHCIVQHGPIVGIIHRIHSNNTHSTLIFFFDEYVHESTGFGCGNKDIHADYLKALVSMLPGCNKNVEGDITYMIGSSIDKLYQKAKNDQITIHYIFKPDYIIGKEVINSLGYKIFEKYCQDIYIHEKGLIMEVERP